ncbi:MAG: ABC transporter substrate-binding protein [Dehalococcoidia bacterium]|nr:ABC transporter substrate-binding protein [Dehalococcoidia bacterium]
MRSLRMHMLFGGLLLVSLVLVACGGGSSAIPPTATSSISAPIATTAPITTPGRGSAGAAAVPTAPATGTILDNARILKPELDNVRYGGTLVQIRNANPAFLDPKYFAQMDAEAMFYEKLAGWEADPNTVFSRPIGVLAEKWTISSDLKTYTFALRKGIKWHNIAPVNGRELVADDVAFSLNRYRDNDSDKYFNYKAVESVVAPDKYTVVIKLKEPDAWGINNLFGTTEYTVAPEVVAEGNGRIGTKGIGTGPYILKAYAPRRGYSFVRNPEYWAKDEKGQRLPYTDAVESPFISDPATVMAGYRTGQIDLGGSIGGTDALLQLAKSIPDIRISNIGISQESGLSFNVLNAPWNDVRVRRAWNMLMDKEKYIRSVSSTPYWEYTTPIPWSLVSDEPFTFDKLGPYYKYNPAEAKKLLTEAGFPDGKMTLTSKLEFSSSPAHTFRSTLFQQLYKENGINFEITQMDTATYFQKWYERSHKDISLNFSNHGDWSLNWYANNKYERDATQNTSHIDDPEMQKLIKEVRVATDPAKIRQFAKIFWDFDTLGSYYIYTPVELTYGFTAPRVRNYVPRRGDNFTSALKLPWLADAPRTAQ